MLWTDWNRTDLAVERTAMVKERVGQVPESKVQKSRLMAFLLLGFRL